MATPGQLVTAMAEDLGVREATLTNYDRQLVISGLRTKAGRGRGAARMTSQDAANILIAVLSKGLVDRPVPERVRIFGGLTVAIGQVSAGANTYRFTRRIRGVAPWMLPRLPIRQLQALPAGHSFRDALVALIDAAIARQLLQNHYGFRGISVQLWGPSAGAEITIRGGDAMERRAYDAGYQQGGEPPGLSITHEISEGSILSLGDVLRMPDCKRGNGK